MMFLYLYIVFSCGVGFCSFLDEIDDRAGFKNSVKMGVFTTLTWPIAVVLMIIFRNEI